MKPFPLHSLVLPLTAFARFVTRLPATLRVAIPAGQVGLGILLFLGATALLHAAPLSGTKSVGPTGNYASLTAAIADVNAVGNGLGGALILELQPAYVSTVETFPLTIPALNGASAANRLTIRPATGATALSISSADTTAATIDLNGAQFVTIDGRPGGAGSNAGSGGGAASQLTIENTSTSGVALRFINEATSNTIRYTTLRGVNTSNIGGVVVFGSTSGANGNDNNTVNHCDIGDGASTPVNGIYSSGSAAPADNSGNTVSNCNVFNFYASVDSAGVRLDGGNTDWTATGNSFYQTASRVAVAANVRAIYINNASGNNFTVTGNFIGGSARNAGGTAWTTTGTTVAYLFQGIRLNVGTTTPSSVNGNTIANIVWTSSSGFNTLPGVWSGIYVSAGSADTISGNTIGSGTGTGSISVTTSGSDGTAFGIGAAVSGTRTIASNTIGSITTNGTTSSISASLTGILVTAGANTIANNTIGSTTTANSLNAATASTSNSRQQVTGIYSFGGTSASITGNTVANLNNNYVGINGYIQGIVTSSGVNTITGNTVRNLSTASGDTGTTYSAAVLGISQTSNTAGQIVSQNVVHSLADTAAGAGVQVYGIYYAGGASTGNVIARNLVHSLSVASTSTLSSVYGMSFGYGSFTAQNNMVRVGLDASGAGTAGPSHVYGILDGSTTDGRNFHHNSVFVGGAQTITSNFTHAFNSAGSSNTRDFRNNIFVNARNSNSGVTSKHFAVYFSAASTTGLTANNNLYFVSGTGGVLGYFGGDKTTLAAWQTATGVDAASLNANPLFINPTGNATTVDLHVQPASPTSGGGAAIAAVTDDFDGQPRNPVSPDIGSDEFPTAAIGVEQPAGTSLLDGTSTVAFGWVPNGTPMAKTFTIRNTGDASLTVGAISKDGTDAGLFAVDATGVGSSLAPGGTFTFTVTFTPDVTGNKSAALHIANGDPNRNPFDIALTGIGFTGSPLSGTKTIGPTGSYSKIGNAILDAQGSGFGGPLVLELQPGYSSTVETFPLTFANLGTTAAKTLTLRPKTGATGLVITSADTTAATVDLNGAQFVIIDGRPGGTGTAKQLTIANTSTSGIAVRFINEGSNNTLRYLTLKSVNTSYSSGTVVFGTTTGVNGNDGNKIDHCDIRDGATTPTIALYSVGSTGSPAKQNSGNTVSNCNIFNFYSVNSQSAGVWLLAGNSDWTISGNSFYQTASRATNSLDYFVGPIYINNTSGNNFTITGNFIGGGAPNAGGTAWTTTGPDVSYDFRGIYLVAGNITPSSIQGNVIRNIVWWGSSAWTGIFVGGGSVNVGTVTGNTVGSGTGTGSISITSPLTPNTNIGIRSTSADTVIIANNTVGSITTNGSSTTVSAPIVGIHVINGTNTIANNTVGSLTTPNSLNAATPGTFLSDPQLVTGILVTYFNGPGSIAANITGNTVANLHNNYASASYAQIRGIVTTTGVNVITGNTVRNLSTTNSNVSTNATQASVLGIVQSSVQGGQVISQNVVHSLSNSAASAAATVTGICFSGGATARPNVIERNLVHSLSVASSSASAQLHGMYFNAGTFTAQNNMVRVGLNAAGAGSAGAASVHGIRDVSTGSGRNFYHNSVFVGGTQTSGPSSTFAFNSSGGNSLNFRNNIFVNGRSNSGGTGKHYAVASGGAVANNNLYFVNGTGGVLGSYGGTDRATLAAWQAASGMDGASLNADPLFANPAGTSVTGDLHVKAGSPVESTGTVIASVADDFDGQDRGALSPADIGADAGDFGFGISYPLLGSGTTANRVLTGWAGIISGSGISGSPNKPRFYFKKSTDADVFGVANNSAGNGWKYVAASNGSSPYSFTVNHSLLTGGGVSVGDTIQYFVVAQDTAGNFKSNPIGAVTTGNSVQNVSAKPAPGVNSYAIVNTIGGTVTVGPGGTFTTLSGAGGLFAALNSRVLTGNLTVNLTGNTTEDGSTVLNALNSNAGYPLANAFNVTIKPDSATMRTISGAAASGLIRLNGVQRVTFDGRFGGGGRYLTFRNTNTSGATIVFINDASNNTVRNCVVEGAASDANVGVVLFSTGTLTGNDNNTVTGCQIRDRSDAAGVPASLVVSAGSWETLTNSNNTISNNELFNFTTNGVNVASASDSWSITGNTIYETAARTTDLIGIFFNGLGTNTIRGNIVRDLSPSPSAYGVSLSTQTGDTTVSGNRIWNLGSPGGSAGIVFIPGAGQSVTVVNNMVAISSAGATAYRLYGIQDLGANGSTTVIAHNTVLITGVNTLADKSTWAFNRIGASTATVKNNIFLNLRTRIGGGSGGNFAANQLPVSTGTLTMDYNVYAGTTSGTTANFFDSSDGTGNLGFPISYAQWQTNIPSDTHSSADIAGSGNFTSAMFVDPANGDLHVVPGGNVLVNALGTPISGVTDDYDGDPRSPTTPSIGADEFPVPDIAVAEAVALTDGESTVDFGTSSVGYSSVPKTFTITNPGPVNLASLAVTKDGTGAGSFTVSALSATSIPVGAGTATLTVTFTPGTGGAKTAAIHIASNVTGAKNPFDIALTGTGATAENAEVGNWAERTVVRNLPTAAGSKVDIGTLTFTGGTGTIEAAVNANAADWSVAKRYVIPVRYNLGNGSPPATWLKVLPTHDTGADGANDFDLDINVTNATVLLRLRTVGGSGAAATARIAIKTTGLQTFTNASATAGAVVPAQTVGGNAVDEVRGKAGIGAAPSANAVLDVNGGDTRGLHLRPRSVPGAPTTGTWSVGTIILDSAMNLYICTAPGTPGTWKKVGN